MIERRFMVGGYLLVDGVPQKITSIAGESVLLEGETRWMGRADAERYTYSGPVVNVDNQREVQKKFDIGQMGRLRF